MTGRVETRVPPPTAEMQAGPLSWPQAKANKRVRDRRPGETLVRIVILGAGFAGLTAATELDRVAAAGRADVVLIDRSSTFRMGFSMQWVLAGRRTPGEGERSYTELRARAVKVVRDEVIGIDTASRTVRTKRQRVPYDYLVIALGAELVPEVIPGLAETAHNLCDLASVRRLKADLEGIHEGTVLVAIASVPFKCPPAPYEYALLIDEILRRRGVRDRVEIRMTTPEPRPMPVAGKAVGDAIQALLVGRGIDYHPGQKPREVDVARRVVSYESGEAFPFSILAAMPTHRAPKVLRDAGLVDASGFVPVDLRTFRTTVPSVYAVGDVAALKLPNGAPHPKAGVFAEAQALTVATSIAAQLGMGEPAPYTGTGVCFIDVGGEFAAAAEASLLLPDGPRVDLSPPSREGLAGKAQFERERLARWFRS